MTPQKAIDCIDEVLCATVHYDETLEYELTTDDIEWLKMAKEALDKQIPQKVKIEKYAPTRCNCGFEFSIHYGDGYYSIPFELKTPYCRNCGQAIDWSGDK